MELHDYRSKDLELLYQLFYAAVHATHHYSESQKRAWAPSSAPESFSQGLGEDFTLLAFEKEQPIGYVQLKSDGLLHAIYTHPNFQGRGVGRALMEAALQEAERLGLKRVHLEASQNARGFYEKLGFVATEERPKICRGECFIIAEMSMKI